MNLLDTHTVYGLVSGLVATVLIYALNKEKFKFTNKKLIQLHVENITKKIQSRPRILCWIPTIPKNYKNRTLAVQETWGPDCDITIFFSEVSDDSIPVVGLGVEESRDNLAQKTMAALRYIYDNYIDKADWFLKADDDTYVIVKNLRHFLLEKDPDAPYYYGSVFNTSDNLFNSGGAGYVMGRNVLIKVIDNSEHLSECTGDGPEDMRIGKCLKALGVTPGRSTDDQGLELFHWSSAEHFVKGLHNENETWIEKYQHFWSKEHHNKLSRLSTTFHYMSPEEMRSYHFLINRLVIF